jgi:type I restriction enzyme S subunit
MKQSWEIKKLGEVCKLTNGYAFQSKQYTDDGYFVIRIGNVQDGYIDLNNPRYIKLKEEKQKKFILSDGDVLVSLTGNVGRVGIIREKHLPAVLNQRVAKIAIANSKLDKNYLFYFLTSDYFISELINAGRGAAQQNISTTDIENLIIPLPPLPEQQRIVSILDECFAAIDKAKTNAEQNLKNAKELFESYLQGVFEKKGDGWEEQLFENCFKLKSGENLTAKNMTEGAYPVFGGNGIAGYHNEYNLSGSNVIIGRVGALCGNVRHITENIWLTDNAFKVVDFNFDFDHTFLTYLLNYKDLRSYARQAAQPVISNSSLKDVVLHFPKSKGEQQTIVRQLDALRAETQKLEAVYQKKIADLEELRKSILQKAFAGELKSEKAVVI